MTQEQFERFSLLIRVRAPHYCAGLITVNGVCTEAAPILRWAIGKRWANLRSYFHRKRFEVIEMPDPRPKKTMTPDLDKRLRSAWPLVFPKPLLNDEPIRCGDGWFHILVMLCRDMTRILEQLPPSMQARLCAVQVKEKFGTLRFYLEDDDPTSPVAPLIRAAEKASAKICDVCGNPGTLRGAENTEKRYFWVRTRCDEHVNWFEPVTGFAHASEPKT